MKIQCQACGTRYSIADDKVRGTGRTFKIRCKNCGEMMTIQGLPTEEWHYAVGSDQHGPVSQAQLAALVGQGTVTAETYVWKQGMDGWSHLHGVAELAALLGQPAEPGQPAGSFAADADPMPSDLAAGSPGGGLFGAVDSGGGLTQQAPVTGPMTGAATGPTTAALPAGSYARRESSVLFNMNELGQQDKARPASERDDFLTDSSGLIDIRAIAMNQQPMAAPEDNPFSDMGAASVVAPVMPSVASVSAPMVKDSGGGSRRMIIALFVVLLLAGGGAAAWLLLGDGSGTLQSASAADVAQVERERAQAMAARAEAANPAGPAAEATHKAPAAAKRAEDGAPAVGAKAQLKPADPPPGDTAVGRVAAEDIGAPPAEAADKPAEAADKPAEAADKPAEAADKSADTAAEPAEVAVAKVGPKPKTDAKPKPKPKSKPKPKAKADAKPKPKADAKPKPKPKAEPKPKADSKGNAKDVNALLKQLGSGDGDGGDGVRDSSLPKRLSAAAVKRTLKKYRGKFSACYRLMDSPSSTRMTVGTSFVIKGATGSVASARVTTSGGSPKNVQDCIVRALKGIGFPKFQDAQMVVNYPIALR